jgi:hypothetical protein
VRERRPVPTRGWAGIGESDSENRQDVVDVPQPDVAACARACVVTSKVYLTKKVISLV